MTPPGMEQDDDGKHHHRRLAQQRGEERRHRPEIRDAITVGVVMQVRQHRHQQKGKGERVLEFAHPGDRLDRDRMDGKEKSSQPRQPDSQPAQETPHQQRAGQVQGHVRQVIAGHTLSPEVPLQPLDRILERKKIGPARREPDRPQAPGSVERRIVKNARDVVEEPFTLDGRRKDPEPKEQDNAGLDESHPAASFPMQASATGAGNSGKKSKQTHDVLR